MPQRAWTVEQSRGRAAYRDRISPPPSNKLTTARTKPIIEIEAKPTNVKKRASPSCERPGPIKENNHARQGTQIGLNAFQINTTAHKVSKAGKLGVMRFNQVRIVAAL